MHLSKSKYCAFWQCLKMAWLNKYKPEERIVDDSVTARMEAGTEVGELARSLFGEYVDITVQNGNGLNSPQDNKHCQHSNHDSGNPHRNPEGCI